MHHAVGQPYRERMNEVLEHSVSKVCSQILASAESCQDQRLFAQISHLGWPALPNRQVSVPSVSQ